MVPTVPTGTAPSGLSWDVRVALVTADDVRDVFIALLSFWVLSSGQVVLDRSAGLPSPTTAIATLALLFALGQHLREGLDEPMVKRPELRQFAIVALVTTAAATPAVLVANDVEAFVTAFGGRLRDLSVAAAFVILAKDRLNLRAFLVGATAALALLSLTSLVHRLSGATGEAFFGLAVELPAEIEAGTPGNRTSGPVNDPNYFAQHLIVLATLAVGSTVLIVRRWWRLLVLAIAFLTAPVLITTFSRGALVALALALWIGRPRSVSWRKLAVGVVLLVVAIVSIVPGGTLDRVSQLRDLRSIDSIAASEDASLRGRSSEIIAGLQMFGEHPLFGVGLGNYEDRYLDYSETIRLDPRREDRSAHSLPVEVLAEQGLVGGIAWAGAVVWLWRLVARRRADSPGLVRMWRTAVVAYGVTALVLHDAYPRLLWVLVALALAIANLRSPAVWVNTTRQVPATTAS